ncbi:MAG: peptidoglycan editing factor PgeF [Gammaproteobacteria bacterium]|jgi:YfiH family protein
MEFIKPNWPAPKNINAVTTTRASLNLSHYVDDDLEQVMENRSLLYKQLNLPSEPVWLNQQHSTEVINLGKVLSSRGLTAGSREQLNLTLDPAVKPRDDGLRDLKVDGAYTNKANVVCAVLTADCLPILLCSNDGTEIAAIHAGWRGLLNGVVASGVRYFKCQPDELFAWLGPAISQQAFEVGEEVREAFIQQDSQAVAAFYPSENSNHFMADLYQLARFRLHQLGIDKIYGGGFCTYSDHEKFYSYRRDQQTGRMATLIWRTPA